MTKYLHRCKKTGKKAMTMTWVVLFSVCVDIGQVGI
jgi:hypothetical protein